MMMLFLGYSFYRFIRKRELILLLPICAQVFASVIAVFSFINDVKPLIIIEIVFVLFGLLLPMIFIVTDYRNMTNRIKNGGTYEGLVQKNQSFSRRQSSQTIPQGTLNTLAKDKHTADILKNLDNLPEEMQRNFRKCLNHVEALVREGNLHDSFLVYETLCKIAGSSWMLYYNFAGLCYKMKKYDVALEMYKKALELAVEDLPAHEDIFYNIGNTYFMLNKPDKACKYFEKAIELNPANQQAVENLSFAYIRLGETEKGIDILKRLNVEKTDDHTHFVMGVLLHEAGKYEEAEEELKRALMLHPDSTQVLEELGKVLMKINKTDEAINTYEKLIRIAPGNYHAWFGKAGAYLKAARWKEAVYCYEEAIHIRPDCYRSYYNMAAALEGLGNHEAAIDAYQSAIAINPDFAEAYNNLGILLSITGRREDALEVYEEGIRRNKKHDGLYFNMGICLHEEGKYMEAVTAYRNALDLNPDELEIYYYLGAALTEMRNYNDAIDAYKSALKIKPSDSELYYHIAVVYALLGRYDISMENLKKAIELDSGIRNEIINNSAFDGMRGKSEFKELVQ